MIVFAINASDQVVFSMPFPDYDEARRVVMDALYYLIEQDMQCFVFSDERAAADRVLRICAAEVDQPLARRIWATDDDKLASCAQADRSEGVISLCVCNLPA